MPLPRKRFFSVFAFVGNMQIDMYFFSPKTGFLCVTVLAVLELALEDQVSLELTELHLSLSPKD